MKPVWDLTEVRMKETAKTIAFVLLVIGTVGLLINEFAFDWGRGAVLVLACLNFVGLVILLFTAKSSPSRATGGGDM